MRLSRRGLGRILGLCWLAVWGGERVEKFAHVERAHLGFERLKATRNDRQECGRVEGVKPLKRIVRGRNEQRKIERYGKTQQNHEK